MARRLPANSTPRRGPRRVSFHSSRVHCNLLVKFLLCVSVRACYACVRVCACICRCVHVCCVCTCLTCVSACVGVCMCVVWVCAWVCTCRACMGVRTCVVRVCLRVRACVLCVPLLCMRVGVSMCDGYVRGYMSCSCAEVCVWVCARVCTCVFSACAKLTGVAGGRGPRWQGSGVRVRAGVPAPPQSVFCVPVPAGGSRGSERPAPDT